MAAYRLESSFIIVLKRSRLAWCKTGNVPCRRLGQNEKRHCCSEPRRCSFLVKYQLRSRLPLPDECRSDVREGRYSLGWAVVGWTCFLWWWKFFRQKLEAMEAFLPAPLWPLPSGACSSVPHSFPERVQGSPSAVFSGLDRGFGGSALQYIRPTSDSVSVTQPSVWQSLS